MFVAQFKTAEETNDFIKTVVLSDSNPVQNNGEDFIVFYEATKETYEEVFYNRMIEGLTRNLFHEELRLASIQAEVDALESGKDGEKLVESKKRLDEAKSNINIFETKISGLQAWHNMKS